MVADARMAAALPWVVVALWASVVAWSALGFRRARHTTLAAPAAWCVASALTIAAVEFYLEGAGVPDRSLKASVWRYASAVSTCCPLIAVLGAKRPQDRGWQWIVVSLWVTLLVPAGQAIAISSAGGIELFVVWRLLLAGLIMMSLLNYLPTRYAVPVLLSAAAQTLLLHDYFFAEAHDPETYFLVRVGPPILLLTAYALVEYARTPTTQQRADRHTARWLAFRNNWGAFWALRIMQRFNQTAELHHWPVRLDWFSGLTSRDAPPDAAIEQSLDSLLRRFERSGAGR